MLQCDGLVLDLGGRRILRGHRLEMSVGERVAILVHLGAGRPPCSESSAGSWFRRLAGS